MPKKKEDNKKKEVDDKVKKSPVKKSPLKSSSKKGSKEEGEFKFGRMTKEERKAIIEEALTPPAKETPSWAKYTLEETEYSPDRWVVVVTPQGVIYQEPVPRYMDCPYFVFVLAGIPSKPLSGSKMIFDAEVFRNPFEVKGVGVCEIDTVSFNGTRDLNSYGEVFDLMNGTKKVGGNLVFSKRGEGFTKKESSLVVKEIIKRFESHSEEVKFE